MAASDLKSGLEGVHSEVKDDVPFLYLTMQYEKELSQIEQLKEQGVPAAVALLPLDESIISPSKVQDTSGRYLDVAAIDILQSGIERSPSLFLHQVQQSEKPSKKKKKLIHEAQNLMRFITSQSCFIITCEESLKQTRITSAIQKIQSQLNELVSSNKKEKKTEEELRNRAKIIMRFAKRVFKSVRGSKTLSPDERNKQLESNQLEGLSLSCKQQTFRSLKELQRRVLKFVEKSRSTKSSGPVGVLGGLQESKMSAFESGEIVDIPSLLQLVEETYGRNQTYLN